MPPHRRDARASPNNVLLVGVVGQSLQPGCHLSAPVGEAAAAAIDAIVLELKFLGCHVERKAISSDSCIWWTEDNSTAISL